MKALLTASLLALGTPALAAPVVIDALANSTTGGVGASTGLTVVAGQIFKVTVSPTDLWNAGALPRWSNADGLTGPLFATGSDDSGYAAGTQIGANFGLYSQGNLTAPFGSLVAKMGSTFQLIGTTFNGPAAASGAVELYYFDANNGDNTGSILANVGGVPEPASWALMIGGFGVAGGAMRRRTVCVKFAHR